MPVLCRSEYASRTTDLSNSESPLVTAGVFTCVRLEAIMGLLDEMKEVADLVKKIGDIDLYRKISKLESEVLDLTREKRHAEERIEELERALKFNKELKFKPPFYFADGDPTPYCAACWESKRMAVHVARHQQYIHLRQCPTCKHSYEGNSA